MSSKRSARVIRRLASSVFAMVPCLALIGCGSDHHVSPWPRDVSLSTLMQPADVAAHLSRVDEEMRAEGLALEVEIEGELEDGEPYRIRAYQGLDDLGNARTALRVATRYGVVMALGPTSSHEALRGLAVALLPALGESGTWKSGSDLNGDGMPDVLVSRAGGEVEIWGLHAQGASPYPIEGLAPVTGAMDVDGDGRPDLMGQIPLPPGDALSPRLVEVVTFEDGRYGPDTRSVRAYHQRQLSERVAVGSNAQARVERAWHALRAGRSPKKTLESLDAAVSKDELSSEEWASFRRWRTWLATQFLVLEKP